MAITLGTVTFDAADTKVRESYEEVGGKDARKVEISGLILGLNSADAIEARLDAVLQAVSDADFSAALSIRPGRRTWVRRTKFSRDVARDTLVGAFTLVLETKEVFEESTSPRTIAWSIASSGAVKQVPGGGNMPALPTIELHATSVIINPSFSDGGRIIRYEGTVGAGEELAFDGESRKVTRAGMDVTPYTTGLFPEIAAEGSTLLYEDDPESGHQATVEIAVRDRWC